MIWSLILRGKRTRAIDWRLPKPPRKSFFRTLSGTPRWPTVALRGSGCCMDFWTNRTKSANQPIQQKVPIGTRSCIVRRETFGTASIGTARSGRIPCSNRLAKRAFRVNNSSTFVSRPANRMSTGNEPMSWQNSSGHRYSIIAGLTRQPHPTNSNHT